MKRSSVPAVAVAALVTATVSVVHAQPPAADLAAQLATVVKVMLYSQHERAAGEQEVWEQVEALYATRGFQPAWVSRDGRAAAGVLLARMADAHRDGLPAEHYDAAAWRQRLDEMAEDDLVAAVRLDVQLTGILVQFARHLALGVGDTPSQRDIDVARLLAEITGPRAARQALVRLEPPNEQYRRLREALAAYRRLQQDGGWRSIPEGTLLKYAAGDAEGTHAGRSDHVGSAIAALCARLGAEDRLPQRAAIECASNETSYGAGLEAAVRQFQARHGLTADGIVGPNTIAALNVPVEERVTQLLVNMNRWRRLPDDLGAEHVFVNVPGFRLEAREEGGTVLQMKVVAGEPETPTPVMSDEISYLDFRPYWNVPTSITENELLPKIARDPGYLRDQQLEIVDGWEEPATIVDSSTINWQAALEHFPYRLRQRPGSHNSLGLVKFMFPNEYSVYLHDTPATHRFEERRRAFSHGCVRVEDPVALAAFLLPEDSRWSRDAIRAAMHGGERQVVPLDEPVPVHLTYFTAWVEEDVVQFRHDLYGRDEDERRAFERAGPAVTAPTPDDAAARDPE